MPPRRFPDGPSARSALRNLRDTSGGRDLSAYPPFFTGLSRRYGPIAHWSIFGRHFYFLDDAALIEEVLVSRARDYKKGRGTQRLRGLLGNGLLTSEEPLHLRQRRMMQPAFHKERIAGYGEQMVAAATEQLAQWQPGATLDIGAEMAQLTLTIAARTLLGANVGEQTQTIRGALAIALSAYPASFSRFGELLDALPFLPVTRRARQARAALDAVIYGLIANRRAGTTAVTDDLLGMLLAARDDDVGMDDAQIRDEALTLFIAGHETTANALAWTWYLLARHPAVAERLHEEVDALLGGRLPVADDVTRLRYTHDVFAEAMRLYPPAWAMGRAAIRETTLGEYAIPRGATVIVSQLVTHRNPRYWPDPDAFVPERWSAAGARPRGAYFPFGGGNRRCIGESFAWLEGILLTATIAQRAALEPVDGPEVEIQPLVTLRPRSPIRLRFGPRTAAGLPRGDS